MVALDLVRRENAEKSAFLPTATVFLLKPEFCARPDQGWLPKPVGIFSEFQVQWLKNALKSHTLNRLRKKVSSEAV